MPHDADAVQASFEQQAIMGHIGASLASVRPGVVEVELPYRPELGQQDGFLHAGVVATIADSAGGYAGWTLMPDGARVLGVEFSIHLMRPAVGDRFVARGEVIRPGRTLTTCRFDVYAFQGDERKHVATGTQTVIAVLGP